MASREGIDFAAANGAVIKNYGQKFLPCFDDNWVPTSVNVQVADAKSNLAGGMRICQAGDRIILDIEDGSYIENKLTGDKISIRHENG